MYKSIQLIVLLCLALFLGSCSHAQKTDTVDKRNDSGTIVIEGVVANGHAEMLYLQRLDVDTLGTPFRNYESVSNSKIEGGKFSMSYTPVTAGPAFYRIGDGKGNFIITVASPGDRLSFKFPVGDTLCRNYTVTGGADAPLMCELDHHFSSFIDSVNHLLMLFQISDEDTHTLINDACSKIMANHTSYLRNFIRKNPASLTSVFAFYQKYQNVSFFEEQQDIDLLETICQNLSQKHPQSTYSRWLCNHIEMIRPLSDNKSSNNQ